MRYLALATDYDGTLAHDGVADEDTLEALRRFRQSGRKLILVTGRELPSLEQAFPHLDLFDRVVAENGAILFDPASREKRILAEGPLSALKDTALGEAVRRVEQDRSLSAAQTRQEITKSIEAKYTAPV